jgi:hypothetical protein
VIIDGGIALMTAHVPHAGDACTYLAGSRTTKAATSPV